MKWYIAVKFFAVLYTSIGPFDSHHECIERLHTLKAEALQRYEQGQRITFMGLVVKPQNASASCLTK